jgi:hypothetical protein
MSELWLLSEAQMRQIEPYFRFLMACRGWTIGGEAHLCDPGRADVA